MSPIYIWQRIISPHMGGLAAALASKGVDVVYVAEQAMSPERARQGWRPPSIGAARLKLVPNEEAFQNIVKEAPADSIHLCQGIRSNGLVNRAQRALAWKGQEAQVENVLS